MFKLYRYSCLSSRLSTFRHFPSRPADIFKPNRILKKRPVPDVGRKNTSRFRYRGTKFEYFSNANGIHPPFC